MYENKSNFRIVLFPSVRPQPNSTSLVLVALPTLANLTPIPYADQVINSTQEWADYDWSGDALDRSS